MLLIARVISERTGVISGIRACTLCETGIVTGLLIIILLPVLRTVISIGRVIYIAACSGFHTCMCFLITGQGWVERALIGSLFLALCLDKTVIVAFFFVIIFIRLLICRTYIFEFCLCCFLTVATSFTLPVWVTWILRTKGTGGMLGINGAGTWFITVILTAEQITILLTSHITYIGVNSLKVILGKPHTY